MDKVNQVQVFDKQKEISKQITIETQKENKIKKELLKQNKINLVFQQKSEERAEVEK